MTMRRGWFIVSMGLCLVGSVAGAHAATYVMSPSDRFADMIPRLRPGDTLLLGDGTYTNYPRIQCGSTAANGTAGAPITIRAAHERRAFIKGNGSAYPFHMIGCRAWVIDGLRIEGGDFANSSVDNGHTVYINQSTGITFRRNLVRFNNRYKNGSIVSLSDTTDALIEENEVYSYHRNGMGGGNANIYRRNYINSRAYADLPGGFPSLSTSATHRGDSGLILYPSSHNVLENNITEGNERGVDINANGVTKNNRMYGHISLDEGYGALVTARGSGTNKMPHDTLFVNFVAVHYHFLGLSARSAEGTECQQCSFFGGSGSHNGIGVDAPSSYPGDGYYSFFGTNILALQHGGAGIMIADDINQWSMTAVNSFAGSPNYRPASGGQYSQQWSKDPQMQGCYVSIPPGSPMKGAGKNGADIGANILYRYQDGALTSQPLWEPGTGRFPCGAIVPGVNDLAGQSCVDVHQRLHVNTPGCSSVYAGTPPSAPGPLPPPTAFRLVPK